MNNIKKIKINKKIHLVLLMILILTLVFMFLTPINSYKGVSTSGSNISATCQGYLTKDGLPPHVDEYKQFHILKGGFNSYKNYKEEITPATPSGCVGGLKIIKAQLFL